MRLTKLRGLSRSQHLPQKKKHRRQHYNNNVKRRGKQQRRYVRARGQETQETRALLFAQGEALNNTQTEGLSDDAEVNDADADGFDADDDDDGDDGDDYYGGHDFAGYGMENDEFNDNPDDIFNHDLDGDDGDDNDDYYGDHDFAGYGMENDEFNDNPDDIFNNDLEFGNNEEDFNGHADDNAYFMADGYRADYYNEVYGDDNAINEVDDNNNDDEDYDDDEEFARMIECDEGTNVRNVTIISPADFDTASRKWIKEGLSTYFEGIVGGKNSIAVINRKLNMASLYCGWQYLDFYGESINFNTINLIKWFFKCIKTHYPRLADFTIYLEQDLNYEPNSVYSALCMIMSVAKFITLFKIDASQGGHAALAGFQHCTSMLGKNYRAQIRKNRTDLDEEVLVQRRLIPVNGLKDMMEVLDKEILWIRSWIISYKQNKPKMITNKFFTRFMRVMYSCFYVFSIQGRSGGLHSANCSCIGDLINNGFVMLKYFKTRGVYGYQPFILSKRTREILRFYVTEILPRVSINKPPRSSDPLFVTFSGVRDTKIGKGYKAFWTSKLETSVTITRTRSMVETLASKLEKAGLITGNQRNSISKCSGHNSATVEAFYHYRDRMADVAETRNVMEIARQSFGILENQANEDNAEESFDESDWPTEAPKHAAIVWGEERRDFGKSTLKAMWSREELTFIHEWRQKFSTTTRIRSQEAKYLLKYILGPGLERARPIFHERHTLNSDRIRDGLRQVRGERPSRFIKGIRKSVND